MLFWPENIDVSYRKVSGEPAEEVSNPSKVHSESNFHFSHVEKEPDSSAIFLGNDTEDENLTAIWKQHNWADRMRRMWRETFTKTETQEYQNPNAATAANQVSLVEV